MRIGNGGGFMDPRVGAVRESVKGRVKPQAAMPSSRAAMPEIANRGDPAHSGLEAANRTKARVKL